MQGKKKKKKEKVKRTKQDHVCVRTWRSEFMNQQKQIIQRVIC